MSKKVYVILAFHAHEPLWELPLRILKDVDDEEMKSAVQSVNWVKKRVKEGRDIYADLIDFATELGVPVALEATNELLVQLAQVESATFSRLGEAYRTGLIYPIYGNAHHSHTSLLNDFELTDDIRLNREFVHDILQAPEPKYRGLFPSEDSIDAAKLSGIKAAGIDFVIFPHLDRRKTRFRVLGASDTTFAPFTIGDGLIALPRHFPISQEIWRPITRMEPENLSGQGYLLGEYWVLPEEYRRKRSVSFPISYEEAVAEYRKTLERAIDAAPDGGLLLYIQDLELMDFGDTALAIMKDAWRQVRSAGKVAIKFATPDEYLDEAVFLSGKKLGRVKFHQISWAPEIRLVLRSDGHYPPLGSGDFRGIDSDKEIFKRWPFIFWETGRYINETCNWLLQSFGFSLVIDETAERLNRAGYQFSRLPLSSRLALHSRFMKRACNWGWQPDEARHKWPYLHAYAIAQELLVSLDEEDILDKVQGNIVPLSPHILKGLASLPDVIVDTRVAYLRKGLEEQQRTWQKPLDQAFLELDRAMALRRQAVKHLGLMEQSIKAIRAGKGGLREVLTSLLEQFKAHCKAMFMAIDHIQRAWGATPSVEDMVISMYRYLYDIYPPKFLEILEGTLTRKEAADRQSPRLI